MNLINKTFVILCLFLLVACSTTSEVQDAEKWDGRFSIQSENSLHVERHSGSFSFIATETRKQLKITGPLGAHVATIEESPKGASITQGDDTKYAQDSRYLIEQATGIPAGLKDIQNWLQGKENPQSDLKDWKLVLVRNEDGTIRRVSGTGFHRNTASYITLTLVPKRIK